MNAQVSTFARVALWLLTSSALCVQAQTSSNERSFPQSKATIEKAVAALQPQLAGHLPVLDGFATSAEHPLSRYKRGYYQATVQVSSSSSGSAVVRVSTKVTAWYDDPARLHSGYQLLTSNGRIEADLLDQLSEQLAKGTDAKEPSAQAAPTPASSEVPAAAAPTFSESANKVSQSLNADLAKGNLSKQLDPDKGNKALRSEAASLEEILKSQAHPKNLVAVKTSGTPVVASPSLTAKPLFLASMHDEFEILDLNQDWVHVRISGLSRGWIWRDSLEMPEGMPNADSNSTSRPAQMFHTTREEVAQFPGDWEPLRGKQVKIISVQKSDNATNTRPQDRLDYARLLLQQKSAQTTGPNDPAGIVLIFDSADGGMIAATASTLQKWRAGALSDSALWQQSLLDPADAFDPRASSASR